MSDIREALAQLYLREAELALVAVDIRGEAYTSPTMKVWPLMPPSRVTITDTPCIVNLLPDSRTQFMPSLTRSNFTVNMRLICYDSDEDIAGEQALAFYPEVVSMVRSNIKLGLSKWFIKEIRTEREFLRLFDEYMDSSGRHFIGLDLLMDLQYDAMGNNAPGAPPP